MDAVVNKIRYPYAAPPAAGEAIEVADGILWFRLPLPMKLDHVNIYALREDKGWTIIDTGFATGKTKKIWQDIFAGPLQGKPVHRVIVTHHHPDHIGLAGWFQSEFGADLWTTRTAWLFARMLTLDRHAAPAPETLLHYRRAGMDADTYARREVETPFNFADVVDPMPLGYRRIQQNDTIEIGGRLWDVHIGNGHAPEHATFWCRDAPLVIAGDQILPSISSNLGVYATEPDADPVGDWLESCERLLQLAQSDHLVLPGHNKPFTGLPVRLNQLIDNHHGALTRLEKFLEQPRTAVECFATLFKRSIGDGEYGLALVEAVAHVNHLYRMGKLTRTTRDDGAWLWQIHRAN